MKLEQFVDQDGDENDVVDTEHEFQRGQREEGNPDFGGEQEFNHGKKARRKRGNGQRAALCPHRHRAAE